VSTTRTNIAIDSNTINPVLPDWSRSAVVTA
jgi:hypothetical protein